MIQMGAYSLNINGKLLDLTVPGVMGIINVTPDSFYATYGDDTSAVLRAVRSMLADGASLLDIGGCSTRPGSSPVSAEEELRRLDTALSAISKVMPMAPLSIDTFRAEVAQNMIERYDVAMINDISGGDEAMYDVVAENHVAYVLTHNDVNNTEPDEAKYIASVLKWLERRVARLFDKGVADVVVDPGFGFGKTLQQNYHLLRNIDVLHSLDCPVLVGLSHKSMLYKLLGISANDADHATTAANTIALTRGADILRVHDVKHATQAVKVFCEAGVSSREALTIRQFTI